MAENVYAITSQAGIQRDGTSLDSPLYSDALWCRFQRGRPRKIGGYKSINDQLAGPIRGTYLDARNSSSTVHTFSQTGIEKLQINALGSAGGIVDRTPAGFVANSNFTWSMSSMFSSTGGSYAALIAASTPDLADISADIGGGIYAGDLSGTGAFIQISDGSGNILVSGGAVVLQPFLFVYGSNGLIRNSNANDFSTATGWTTGGANFANSANVAGTKIVKGLPMRGGTVAPAGLFWSLDSLIRVTFVGGSALWRYDTISASISVLSKNSIVEYDGLYFWIGIDRFFVYNGVVNELPNSVNLNYFFDNLNYSQRQKVFAVKVPRYGEIWWMYPSAGQTECNKVLIYNVRERTWYDNVISRSAGTNASVYQYPIMAGVEDSYQSVKISITQTSGTFAIGDSVTGSLSLVVGKIVKILGGNINVTTTSLNNYVNNEVLTNQNGSTALITSAPANQQIDVLWQQETGVDKVHNSTVTAIRSYFQTTDYAQFLEGAFTQADAGPDQQTRAIRLEPDFVRSGPMNFYVNGSSFSTPTVKYPNVLSNAYPFQPTDSFINLREQRRIMQLRFESNVIGGNYQCGKNILTFEKGDRHG
jgi:hypothetical protein